MTEQPRKAGALVERGSQEESIIQQVGVTGVYGKLCKAFGTEEVGLAKLTCGPSLTDKEFIHGMWLAMVNKVNPLKRECFFYTVKNKKTGGRDLVFIIAIIAFRARAQKHGMTLLQARAVCEKDDFEWDHVKGQPLRHISPKSGRGRVVSGWGRIKKAGMEEATAVFKDASEWLHPGDSFFHKDMGQHMMEVTIERQMIGMVCPDVFPGAYAPEEFGGRIVDGQLSMDPARTAEPEEKKEELKSLTRDDRELYIKDIRGFMDKTGLGRNAARWAKVEGIIGRKVTGKNLQNLPDWDLRKIHMVLKDETTSEKPAVVEVSEIIPPGGKSTEDPKPEEPEKKEEPCETCGEGIEESWGKMLTQFKATRRDCRPCYYKSEEQPAPKEEEPAKA